MVVMVPDEVFYTAWQPVRINAGAPDANSTTSTNGGFFIDANGLEWENAPGAQIAEFGGWLGQ